MVEIISSSEQIPQEKFKSEVIALQENIFTEKIVFSKFETWKKIDTAMKPGAAVSDLTQMLIEGLPNRGQFPLEKRCGKGFCALRLMKIEHLCRKLHGTGKLQKEIIIGKNPSERSEQEQEWLRILERALPCLENDIKFLDKEEADMVKLIVPDKGKFEDLRHARKKLNVASNVMMLRQSIAKSKAQGVDLKFIEEAQGAITVATKAPAPLPTSPYGNSVPPAGYPSVSNHPVDVFKDSHDLDKSIGILREEIKKAKEGNEHAEQIVSARSVYDKVIVKKIHSIYKQGGIGVKDFEANDRTLSYTVRSEPSHIAEKAGGKAFVLARIAGRSGKLVQAGPSDPKYLDLALRFAKAGKSEGKQKKAGVAQSKEWFSGLIETGLIQEPSTAHSKITKEGDGMLDPTNSRVTIHLKDNATWKDVAAAMNIE